MLTRSLPLAGVVLRLKSRLAPLLSDRPSARFKVAAAAPLMYPPGAKWPAIFPVPLPKIVTGPPMVPLPESVGVPVCAASRRAADDDRALPLLPVTRNEPLSTVIGAVNDVPEVPDIVNVPVPSLVIELTLSDVKSSAEIAAVADAIDQTNLQRGCGEVHCAGAGETGDGQDGRQRWCRGCSLAGTPTCSRSYR